MKESRFIEDIMTQNVITLQGDNSLYQAEKLFKENGIRHIPVVENKKLVGLLSLSDLKRLGFLDAYSKVPVADTPLYDMLNVEDLMIKNLTVVHIHQTIEEVSKILIEKQFHALPVIDKDRLAGIITTTDLLKYFVNYCI